MPPATLDLQKLLSDLFTADELRRLLHVLPHGGELVQALPPALDTEAALFHHTALALDRRRMVNAAFFAALHEVRPNCAAEIAALEAAWTRAAPAAPRRATSPSRRKQAPAEAADRSPAAASPRSARAATAPAPDPASRRSQVAEARPPEPPVAAGLGRAAEGPAPAPSPAPPWNPVRVLHLSDLHFDAKRGWDRDPVLAELCRDVARQREQLGGLDLVLITGDIAFSGKKAEYTLAAKWLTGPLARAAGVTPAQIRVVAGNHDVDRDEIDYLVTLLDRGLLSDQDPAIARVMEHKQPAQRDQLLRRQRAFLAFARRFHPRLKLPWWTERLDVRGWSCRLYGLNTAWLAGSHRDERGQVDDHRRLALGAWQWSTLQVDEDPPDLCIALMHHPWEDLADWDRSARRGLVFERCGVVLSGHRHETDTLSAQAPGRLVLSLAAGACYDGSTWANAFQVLELDPGRGQARLHLRKWHKDTGRWIADDERYPGGTKDGVATLALRRSPNVPVPKSVGEASGAAPVHETRDTPRQQYAAQLKARADVLAQVFRTSDGPAALSEVYVEVRLSGERGAFEAGLEEGGPAVFGAARDWYKRWLRGDEAGRAQAGGMSPKTFNIEQRIEGPGGRRAVYGDPGTGKGGRERGCVAPSGSFKLEEIVPIAGARWAVLGDPGGGKTTLLRHTALHLVEETQHLPVLLKVSELKDSLLASVTESYGAEAASLVKAALADKTAVVLLDGLDEATDKAAARRAVQRLAAELGPTPLVLASRPIGFEAPTADFVELALCPLGREEQKRLLEAWVTDAARVTRALSRLDSSPRLRRLAENPLLLTLVGLLLREDKDIPSRRGELYDSAVQILLTRAADPVRAQRRLREPALAREALAWAALKLHGRAEEVYRTADLVSVLQDHDRHSRNCREIWGGPSGFLTEVAETTGLLVPTTASAEGAPAFAFPHRTFREHLAAVALERDIGIHGIGDISAEILQGAAREDRALDIPPASGELGRVLAEAKARPETWSEVLALVCALLGKGTGDALVRRVAAEGKAALVQRVVAEAEGLSPDTVLAVLGLERGWNKWQDRQKILQDLPALAGDRGLAVRLLDRYRRETTDGNDLFWIRATLTAIAEDPKADLESKREAEEARDRLFEHMQERRAEAVGLLEGLWKPIPAGSFRMGSLDGEGEDREHPQHKVTFKTGFQMMSVPVTWRLYELFDHGHAAAREDFTQVQKQVLFRDGEPCVIADQDQHPAYNVTWYASTMFAAWVAALDPSCHGARLPLEAEWEYACRAGTTTPYWSGSSPADLARAGWVRENSRGHTHPVGEKAANKFGLHDMHGNVWEWCLDLFDSGAYAQRRGGVVVEPAGDGSGDGGEGQRHPSAAVAAPMVTIGGHRRPAADLAAAGADFRVIRGGSWGNFPDRARSAYRYRYQPRDRDWVLGFRLVLPVSPPALNFDLEP